MATGFLPLIDAQRIRRFWASGRQQALREVRLGTRIARSSYVPVRGNFAVFCVLSVSKNQ
jgi:hypothetical protein